MAKLFGHALTDPSSKVFKAVDTVGNKVVGVAEWQIFEEIPTQETLDETLTALQATPELKNEARVEFMKDVAQSRKDFISTQPSVLLAMLVVDPEYQRKGIGHMMLKWGLEKMDELKIIGYLEASPQGKGLYEEFGFKVVRDLLFDTKPWGGDHIARHWTMIREVRGTS